MTIHTYSYIMWPVKSDPAIGNLSYCNNLAFSNKSFLENEVPHKKKKKKKIWKKKFSVTGKVAGVAVVAHPLNLWRVALATAKIFFLNNLINK